MENVLYFSLHENKMTEDPDDCYAIPVFTGTVSEDDLIEEMTSAGSTLTKGEAKLYLVHYKQAIHKKLKAGYTINTGLFNIAPRINGVFKNKNDRFDPARHAVTIKVNPGVELTEVESQIVLEYTETFKLQPVPADFKDVASGLINQMITIGGVGHITGNRLSFDETDNNQGVFFVDINNQATRVTTLIRKKPSELIFMIPGSLVAGNYSIEVRSITKGSKDLRKGHYDTLLPAR